jgi:zinc/manganese transport system substrate-binding protein
MQRKLIFIGLICAILLVVPSSAHFTVASTTAVLWDPIAAIGGDRVEVIYISDPTLCPHLQQDVINNRIQMQKDFISSADLFVAHNGSVDSAHVMPYVEKFMDANGFGTVQWVTPADPMTTWNTPERAKGLATEVKGWLVSADPANATYYEERYTAYAAQIDAADPNDEERRAIAGQDVITMYWQKDPAENWLGLNVVNYYAPDFLLGGQKTPTKLVDDINANPEKYANVTYIIENMQSGELAKGIEETLRSKGISAQRVVFTNFPKSVEGVHSIPDALAYNKDLVTPEGRVPASPPQSPLPVAVILTALAAGILLFCRRT